ncbi:MAG: DNA repair protein RecN, partial [Candidatus Firestonebacteria bacterium]
GSLKEELKPLEKIASGGELSRIMLALKVILGESDKVATLIFDEIDTGIGGNMGGVIGEKMEKAAKTRQVITITHLPQIAAMAGNHLNVTKKAINNKTVVNVEVLTKETRVKEIARMLGDSGKDIAVKHAKELLKNRS